MRGVYIHIPFCRNICSYCDFCKFYYNEEWLKKYLESLKYEIEKYYKKDKIKTIYIGGGTPSMLNISELNSLFEIIKLFDVSMLEEFTIECNVEDINVEKLELFKKNGVTRLSVGVQSFNKKILKYINRDNDVNIQEKILLAKKYIDNINIDMMYGFSIETINDLENDIKELLKLNVNHISYYSLILEDNTKFKNDGITSIDEDTEYNMYKKLNEILEENGYHNYEISNYSKEGFESKHNLIYWDNLEYYGFGLGAAGYIEGVRYSNTKNIFLYNEKKYDRKEEKVTKEDSMKYEMILGLRKIKGISKKEFYNKYNEDIYDVFDLTELIKDNKIIDDGNNIYINKKYIYLSNEILVNFI